MPFMPIEKLDNLMGGAMQEKFRVALAEVLANVRDPNTQATAKRGITLTVIIAPMTTTLGGLRRLLALAHGSVSSLWTIPALW